MRDHESTVRSRELVEGLRQAMQRARLNGRQAAHLLGWSPSWVSRLLSGKRNATELHVAAFLAVCRVTGAERDRLLALCQERHTPGWLQQHGSRLPQQLVTLIDHEDKAVTISEFQSTLVPGLLQTGDYARAVIQNSRTVPADEIEDRTGRISLTVHMNHGRSVIVWSVLHTRRCEIPVPFGLWTHAWRGLAALPAGGAKQRPLLIETAPLFGLAAKLGL